MRWRFRHQPSGQTLGGNVHLVDIGSRTMQGSITTVASQMLRLGLQLLGSMVLARLLAPEDFGLVAMAAVVVGFASVLAEAGLASATVQSKELNHNTVNALFYIQVGVSLGLMALIMSAAPLIAMGFNDTRVSLLVVALAPTLPILAASSQHLALLQRDMRWLKMQGVGVLAQAVGTAIAILVSLTTDIGYWALVIQAWSVAICTCLLAWLWSPWTPGRVSNWSQAMPAVKFGFGLTCYNLLNGWHRQFDNVVIGAVVGPEQLGYYARAYGLLMIPLNAVIRPFTTAVYPAMSRLQSDPPRWRRMFLSSVATSTCLTALIAGLLVLSAEWLVPLLFGDQWHASVPIFRILAISMLIQPVYNAAGIIPFSLGDSHRMLRASYVTTAIYTAAFVIGVVMGGAIGVAVGYTIAVYLITPFWLWWAARGTSLSVLRICGAVAPPILAGFTAFAAAAGLPVLHEGLIWQAVQGGMFCTLYIGLLYLFWLIFEDWRKDVQPVVDRTILFAAGLRMRPAVE